MNLRDLEYLVALAEHRHFGRAAAAVFVTQPTLSTQVKKLEAELGVPLIERGHRSVLLTAVGTEVVEHARRILAEAEDIRLLTQQAASPHRGSLRLGAFPTLAPYLLPHVMPDLTAAFPELELLLVEEKSAALVEQLRAGSLDAAFIALPVAGDDLTVEPLFREDFLLAMPADHRLAQSDSPLPSHDLDVDDLLLLSEGHCLRDQALEVCARLGAHERRGFQATSLETLRLMVAAGVGVTLLPRLSVVPPVASHDAVVLRELEQPRPFRDIALVSRDTHVHHELLTQVAAQVRLSATQMPVDVLQRAQG